MRFDFMCTFAKISWSGTSKSRTLKTRYELTKNAIARATFLLEYQYIGHVYLARIFLSTNNFPTLGISTTVYAKL